MINLSLSASKENITDLFPMLKKLDKYNFQLIITIMSFIWPQIFFFFMFKYFLPAVIRNEQSLTMELKVIMQLFVGSSFQQTENRKTTDIKHYLEGFIDLCNGKIINFMVEQICNGKK